MSQESFGEDDSIFLDEAALAQIESIESSAIAGPSRPVQQKPAQKETIVIPSSDDFFDALPADQLAALDAVTLPRRAPPPRAHLQPKTGASSSQSMYQTHLTFRKENQSTKGKRWDRTAFSATGRRKVQKPKGKGKGRWNADEDEEEDEEDDSGEPLLPDPACDLRVYTTANARADGQTNRTSLDGIHPITRPSEPTSTLRTVQKETTSMRLSKQL